MRESLIHLKSLQFYLLTPFIIMLFTNNIRTVRSLNFNVFNTQLAKRSLLALFDMENISSPVWTQKPNVESAPEAGVLCIRFLWSASK